MAIKKKFDNLNKTAGKKNAANLRKWTRTDGNDGYQVETTKELQKSRFRATKHKNIVFQHIKRRETFATYLKDIPETGQSIHIISKGDFDFFSIVPCMTGLMGTVNEMFGSTWVMNMENVNDLLDLYDEKKIENITIITGLYFKRRSTAVYSQLYQGLMKRGQRYRAGKNHAKVLLMSDHNNNYITIEGSANFTANTRIENYVMTNDEDLFKFHKEWIEDFLKL